MEMPHSDAEPQVAADRGPEVTTGDAGAGQSSSQPAGAEGIPLAALPPRDLLIWFLSVLAAKAWEGMGLVPNPATHKIQKNLDDARTAIDVYAAILDAARAQLEGEPRREMETLLTTLRLNFVEKSAGAEKSGGA